MTQESHFTEAVLAHPGDDGPRLVYADWLEERGDGRGTWLRFACTEFAAAARAAARSTDKPDGGFYLRVDRLLRRPGGKRLVRLAAAAFYRWLPAGAGLVWDRLEEDVRSTVAAAELHACGLLSAEALATPWSTSRLVKDVAAAAVDAAARLAVAAPDSRLDARPRAWDAAIHVLAAAHRLTAPESF
jgi:uncharacterized protein (TIGR02996 family)